MTTTSRWATALVASLAIGGVASPAGASAASRESADRALSAELRRVLRPAGSRASVVVRDTRGRRVADLRGAKLRALGSTTKLFTAAAALGRRPALTTDVRAAAPIAGGVLDGDLVLRGGGDPSLGTSAFAATRGGFAGTDGRRLADRLVARGLREVRGSVVGDESRFDASRGSVPKGGAYDPEYEGVLGGLTWNRGRAGDAGDVLTDPARGAAAALDDLLEARGVVIRGVPRAGATPPGAAALASVTASVPTLVRPMLKTSDDLYADALARALAAQAGGPGTIAAGAGKVATTVRGLGARPRLADGSGLSPRSRGTARDLVGLLVSARRRPWGRTLHAALPVAGRDGTLRDRLRPVRGRCAAKTGSLDARSSALAGTCRTRSGGTLVFAVVVEGQAPARARKLVDGAAVAVGRS